MTPYVSAGIGGEYILSDHWSLYGDFSYQHSLGNAASYLQGMGGIRMRFGAVRKSTKEDALEFVVTRPSAPSPSPAPSPAPAPVQVAKPADAVVSQQAQQTSDQLKQALLKEVMQEVKKEITELVYKEVDRQRIDSMDIDIQIRRQVEAIAKVVQPEEEEEHSSRGMMEYTVLFGYKDLEIDWGSRKALDEFLATLPKRKVLHVQLSDHTDNTDAMLVAERYSMARALNVKRYLVSKGIPAGSISVQAFGSDCPLADNATAEGRAQNRRVVVVMLLAR